MVLPIYTDVWKHLILSTFTSSVNKNHRHITRVGFDSTTFATKDQMSYQWDHWDCLVEACLITEAVRIRNFGMWLFLKTPCIGSHLWWNGHTRERLSLAESRAHQRWWSMTSRTIHLLKGEQVGGGTGCN